MRIMLAASVSPFSGREEIHWTESIRRVLSDNKKYEVDTFMLPIVHNPLLIPEQMTALRLLDIRDSCDMLLTIGFPAFVLKHPNKRVLLFSLASSLHEHFDTEYGILATPQYQTIRSVVHNAEKKCLLESKRIVCASKLLEAQLLTDLNINANPLILGDSIEDKDSGQLPDSGPWIVCESTLEPSERTDLLLSAVIHSLQKWRLLICVPSASVVYRQALDNRIIRLGIKDRVFVYDGPLTRKILKESKGYIAINYASVRIPESASRAMTSEVPMVTTADCGALMEIITPETNGIIVEPYASKIADALDRIIAHKIEKHVLTSSHTAMKSLSEAPLVIKSLVG